MGKKLLETFEKEIKKVKTEKMRKFYKDILEKCDDLNATGPASSSGKYHPIQDLGKYGLYRHSVTVARFAEIMMRSIPTYDNDEDWDIVYISALLHDMAKFDSNVDDGSHTVDWHPVSMAKLIRDFNTENDASFERVAHNIESHHSRWGDLREAWNGIIMMPQPESLEQYIIVFSDLCAANTDLPNFLNEQEKIGVEYLVGRRK